MSLIHRRAITPIRVACPACDPISTHDVLVDTAPGLLSIRVQLPGQHALWMDWQAAQCLIDALRAALDKIDNPLTP